MSHKRLWLLILLIILRIADVCGQGVSNQRFGTKMLDSVVVKLDTLSILPSSFSVNGLEKSDYTMDYLSATLYLHNNELLNTTVTYSYRVFSIDFEKKQFHKDNSLLLPRMRTYTPQVIPISAYQQFMKQDEAQLVSSGSISRGFSVGNNQDLVLNSTLQLQLSGKLTDDLEISANITDKNIPIQPEGNTQNIRDFDRIFICLKYKEQFWLNAGDLDIQNRSTHFMVVNKRLLGMDFISNQKLNNHNLLKNQVGGGINKGKYVRQKLAVINGVQGPYRLTGQNNEVNIIIISGSERVYWDGQLLTRGRENDYVIDYNTGEITFTPKILVTSEKRFVIEFEYKSNYYAQYTLYSFNEFYHEKNKKLKLNVNFVQEQELKNRSIQPQLNDEQKHFLADLGDDIAHALYPNVDSATFNTNEILYIRKDTMVGGVQYESIYIYSTDPTQSLYRLGFSLVGENRGNYVLSQNLVNGRVFKWVAPVNGVPQGNYEPVLMLVPPKLVQLGTFAADWRFSEKFGAKAEFAFSNHDINTFSKKDNADNAGFALKTEAYHQQELKSKKKEEKNGWVFKNNLNWEYKHKNFYTTESYREIEFARKYNLVENTTAHYAEQILQFQTGFAHRTYGENYYRLNYYNRPHELNALRNEIYSHTKVNHYQFGTNSSLLITDDTTQRSHFIASNNHFSKTFQKVEIGATDLVEYNAFHLKKGNSLRADSYAFNQAKLFVKNNDTLPYLYQISYMNRIDYAALENLLSLRSMGNEMQLSFELAKLKNNRIRGNATYRNSQIKDSVGKFNGENFFIGGVEYNGRFFKNAIVLTTYYEVGSGMEQKKTFSYLKVADGQGVFTWRDYNNNGIEELEEFELAAFQDQANYVKIWLTTADYILTYNNQFTQTLQLKPSNVWRNKKGFLKFLSRFANTSTFNSSQKNTDKNTFSALNPFQFNLKDSVLIKSTLNFTNTFSFNQLSSFWGIDIVTQETRNKDLIYYGIESNRFSLQEFLIRGNPWKNLTLKSCYQHAEKNAESYYLSSRNYHIITHSFQESVHFQHKNEFFFLLSYIYKNKKNSLGAEAAQQQQIGLQFNYRMAKKGNLTATIQYVRIKYNGNDYSAISYEMLEGLKRGNNALWFCGYQTDITNYLQIELSYNGRFSDGNKVIHTGNLQLRAHF